MKKEHLDFLLQLLSTPSPSGFEDNIAEIFCKYVKQYAVATTKDTYGNVVSFLNGKEDSPYVLITAHLDEIGLIVSYINEEGYVYFNSIGGIDVLNIIGQKVDVITKKGILGGVIARKPIHLLDEETLETIPNIHELFIDMGLKSSRVKKVISIGDPIVISSNPILSKSKIVGRALDNKAGIWIISQVLRLLASVPIEKRANLSVLATIQEEVGYYGAKMKVNSISPDFAIAVDLTTSTDVPNIEKEKYGDIKLGGGPVFSIGSASNRKLNEALAKVAKKSKISLQYDVRPELTGTDADAIFTKCGGIPTALISLPSRYLHSPVEMVDIEDMNSIIKLIVNFCKSLIKGE